MSAEKTDMHRLQEMVRLHRMGQGSRAIARQMKMSPNTERQYRRALRQAGLLDGDPALLPELAILKAAVQAALPSQLPPQQISSAHTWTDDVQRLLKKGAQPRAIYDWLSLNIEGFNASYWAIKRLCRRLHSAQPVQAIDVVLPVQTQPGEVAQVDFGYVGYLRDPASGKRRKAWVFVMVLACSRHMFACVVFDQTIETWLTLHARAFRFFGGVPAVMVPDNLKAAVIRAAFAVDDVPSINRSYREMARHFGFRIDPAPPRTPQHKGKVESGVAYVKHNFFATNSLEEIEATNTALERWVLQIAGKRLHGYTGKPPLDLFVAIELRALKALPEAAFVPQIWKQATVHTDSHVLFQKRLYSVPWKLLGQKVWIRASPQTIDIFCHDERVASHPRKGTALRSTHPQHLPEHREPSRHRDQAYWEERASRIDAEAFALIQDIFEEDEVLLPLRRVIAIVRLLEQYPVDRAAAACRRARCFGNLSYRALREILEQGLDLQPLREEDIITYGRLESPQYARAPYIPGGRDEWH